MIFFKKILFSISKWLNQLQPDIFTILMSLFLFLTLLEKNGQQLNPSETWYMFFYICVILIVQFIILTVARVRKISSVRFHLLATFFFISNLFFIYLANYPSFLEANFLLQFLLLAGVALFFYAMIHYSQGWVLSLWLALMLFTTAEDIFDQHSYLLDKILPPPLHELPENYQFQSFTHKPNIYILGFDAMLPEILARDMIEYEDAPIPYIDALNALNAEIIPNTFTHIPYTIGSYSSLLALDIGWYNNIYGGYYRTGREMIRGVQPTPTYDLFDKNGYDLRLLYYSDYFKSAFNVNDDANPVQYEFFQGGGICNHVNSPYAFWGFCYVALARNKSQTHEYTSEETFHYGELEKSAFMAMQTDTPTLTVFHTQHPGHTYGKYNARNRADVEAYIDYYREGASKVARYITDYVGLIRKHDPDGIILIISDHGTFLTKGIDKNNIPADSPYDAKDIFNDYHAVTIATLDPMGCQIAGEIVTTLPDMLYNIITCLTDGKPVLKQPYDSEAEFIDYLYDPIASQ